MNCPLCKQALVESTENTLQEPYSFGPVHSDGTQARGHLGCVMDWEHDRAQDRWESVNPNLVERIWEAE